MINPNSKLKIKVADKWLQCDLGYVEFGPNSYVRVYVRDGYFDIYGPRKDLAFALAWLKSQIDGNPPEPMVTKSALGDSQAVTNLETEAAGSQLVDVTKLTPADVVDHFRNSEALQPHVGDVEQLFADEIASDQASRDMEKVLIHCNPADLIDDEGKPVWGAQTTIAAVLGITNAGSYRNRIAAVIANLSRRRNSTTTANKAQTAKKTA